MASTLESKSEWEIPAMTGADVVVAVPDATRAVPWDRTLRPLLERLRGANVRIEVALGLHRPMRDDELEPLCAVADDFGVPVEQHDPSRLDFAPHLRSADAIVCVGIVEPHQYAGFSGGIKTVAIGCAPRRLIKRSHRVEHLRDPRVALGRFYDNPFQDELWARARELPTAYGVYLVPAPDGGRVFAGPAREQMERAVMAAQNLHFRSFPTPVSWLALEVPPSKATNFYQASRAATYVGLVEHPAVAPGGLIVIRAAVPEGIGSGAGEKACAEQMMRGVEPLLRELDGDESIDAPGGAQRAYVIAKTLRHFRIALVSSTCGVLEPLRTMGIGQFETLDDALVHHGVSADGAVVDDPFHQVPIGPIPNDASGDPPLA